MRQRETERDSKRQRETARDSERQRETERDTERDRLFLRCIEAKCKINNRNNCAV